MASAPHLSERTPLDPSAALPLSLWSGLLLVDAVLLSRRLAGAMTEPLTAPLVWGSSLIVAATAVAALALWRAEPRTRFSPIDWWPELLTLAAPLGFGIAVGIGATPFTLGGLAALWGMVIVAVGLVHQWAPETADRPVADIEGTVQGLRVTDDGERLATQWQKRFTLDGADTIEGEAAVHFAPGQKESLLHLSFCPPFAVAPDVSAEDALGGHLEIRAEAVHTFGARLAVRRLKGIEAAESRQISYLATTPADGGAAA